MKEAANLHHFRLPMLLPGIEINTSPTDFAPEIQWKPLHILSSIGNSVAATLSVNRRAKGTPHRHAKGTPGDTKN
jgi:hypothetical protein